MEENHRKEQLLKQRDAELAALRSELRLLPSRVNSTSAASPAAGAGAGASSFSGGGGGGSSGRGRPPLPPGPAGGGGARATSAGSCSNRSATSSRGAPPVSGRAR